MSATRNLVNVRRNFAFGAARPVVPVLAILAGACLSAACAEPIRVGSSSTESASSDVPVAANNTDATPGAVAPDKSSWVREQVEGVTVETLAGSDLFGAVDGVGGDAQFNNPVNLAFDTSGDLLVTDFDNGLVRHVSVASGAVTTVVPVGTFERPFGISVASTGDVFVQTDVDPYGDHDEFTGTVWKVDLATGGAQPLVTNIGRPRGLETRSDGTLFLSDVSTQTVRLFASESRELSTLAGVDGASAFVDGVGDAARFNQAYGTATRKTSVENVDYVLADRLNHVIRVVDLGGTVSTFAGNGALGLIDGPREGSRFNGPKDVAIDAAGNLYVCDNGNFVIRRIGADGHVMTVAGSGDPGFADGPGETARFYGIEGIVVTPDGKTIYVADGTNGEPDLPYHRIRKISLP